MSKSVFTPHPSWAQEAILLIAETTSGATDGTFNAEQLATIQNLPGHHIINSGAGTGKSSCLIARMLRIQREYPDSRVLMISFTKKSAQELHQRIGSIANVTVSTFHSLSYHILRSDGIHYDVVMDDAVQESLIGKLIGKKPIALEEVRRSLHQYQPKTEEVKPIRAQYLKTLQKRKQMTFDTMQIFALQRLEQNPAHLKQWQERFDFFLIDEFQDLDELQHRMIELLSQRTGNLTVVGDHRQAIYSFRGSVPYIMETFGDSATKYELSINYRSNRAILGLANRIMAKDKPLLAAIDKEPIYPQYLMAADSNDEAKQTADEIARLHKSGIPYKEMAVLFRSSAASVSMMQELLSRKIPAVSKSAAAPKHSRMPYCGIVKCFRFILSPDDGECFKRIMPIFYLRRSQYKEIFSAVNRNGYSFLEAAQKLPLPFFHQEYLRELCAALSDAKNMQPHDAALHLLKHGYGKYIGPDYFSTIKEMAEELKEYSSITAYIHYLDSMQEQMDAMQRSAAESSDCLHLMTIHAAKGMEWDAVFLIGAYDGCIPSNHDGIDIEEERRLLYVAVTRAKERLYISYPCLSENHNDPNEVSRFLREAFLG